MEKAKKLLKDFAWMRWGVLILISGITFGTYWFQDFFSPLKNLMEIEMGITSNQFGTLIQWTTWANLFGMIIVGGIVLDKWGIRVSTVIFGALATFGASLTAMGAAGVLTDDPSSQLWIMMIGRLMFGSGLEVTCVIVLRTIVKWFSGYKLALSMGISMGLGRLGFALGTAFSLDIAGKHVSNAVTFAATLVGIGFALLLAYLIFDVKLDRQMEGQAGEDSEEKFKLSDLLKLATNKSFILIAALCVAFYSAVFPFMQYAPDLLVNKFGFTSVFPSMDGLSFWAQVKAVFTNGPKVASLIPLGTILFTPIFGTFVDKKGKAASLMIVGSTMLVFAHLSLSVFHDVTLGYIGLLLLGIAFSLIPAAMWPSVAKIVDKNRLGTAYAAMFTIQNWGLNLFFWGIGSVLHWVNPEVVQKIADAKETLTATGLGQEEVIRQVTEMQAAGTIPPYDYTIPILMLVVLGIISIFLAFALKRADKQQKYGLELPTEQ